MALPLAVLPWWYSQYRHPTTDEPVANGTLTFQIAGTSTPLTTYSDADGATPLGTVVDLDATGYPVTSVGAFTTIWLANSPSYKVILKDSDGVTLRTSDGITDPGAQAFATFGTLSVAGSKAVGDGYAVVSTDRTVTASSGVTDPSTITLPTVVGWTVDLYIMNLGPYVLNIAANSGQTFNGAAGPYVLPEGSGNDRAGVLLRPLSPSGWLAMRFGIL